MSGCFAILAFILYNFIALSESYADHQGVTLFTKQPCGGVISAIDWDPPALQSDPVDLMLCGVVGHLEEISEDMAKMGMAWGFILGFDTLKGGLHSQSQTTLQQLCKTCAAEPNRTAFGILREMRGQ